MNWTHILNWRAGRRCGFENSLKVPPVSCSSPLKYWLPGLAVDLCLIFSHCWPVPVWCYFQFIRHYGGQCEPILIWRQISCSGPASLGLREGEEFPLLLQKLHGDTISLLTDHQCRLDGAWKIPSRNCSSVCPVCVMILQLTPLKEIWPAQTGLLVSLWTHSSTF